MKFTRRQAMASIGAALAARAVRLRALDRVVKNGRLKQSVSYWPYNKIPLPEFSRAVADMGLTAIDLLEEPQWATVREYGLVCSMGYAGGGSIPDALNVKATPGWVASSMATTASNEPRSL